jgi:hypothetical protein
MLLTPNRDQVLPGAAETFVYTLIGYFTPSAHFFMAEQSGLPMKRKASSTSNQCVKSSRHDVLYGFTIAYFLTAITLERQADERP